MRSIPANRWDSHSVSVDLRSFHIWFNGVGLGPLVNLTLSKAPSAPNLERGDATLSHHMVRL